MIKRLTVFVLCFAILNLGSPLVAQAAVIGTLEAVSDGDRSSDLATINAAVARQDVREQMLSLGVEPAQVEGRIAAMTDAELRTLADRMADMPAGGDSVLAVVGIVFLILLILEAVGVIDIFKKFP
jgi:hypothetical protein